MAHLFCGIVPGEDKDEALCEQGRPCRPGYNAEASLAGLVEIPRVVAGSSISSPADPAAACQVDVGLVGEMEAARTTTDEGPQQFNS
jgi:hypothetical protein